jgi:hypothetical protein
MKAAGRTKTTGMREGHLGARADARGFCQHADENDGRVPRISSGSLPLVGRAGEGVEAGTRFRHPSLTLPIKGRGSERCENG